MLLANANASILSGPSYTTKLVVSGSSPVHLEGWVNGTQYIGFDDDSAQRISVGNCGIVNYTAGVEYANFKVDNVPLHLFSDGFNRTSGMGPSWHTSYGSYTTNGGSAISGTPPINGNWANVVPALGTADVSVSADIVIPVNSFYSGLVARSAVATDFDSDLYAAQLSTDGTVALYAGAFETPEEAAWLARAIQAAGVTPTLVYRTGRSL